MQKKTLIGTLPTMIFLYVYLLFYGNLSILFCWYLKFPFLFFVLTSCFQLYTCDKNVIKVAFSLRFIWVYWTALASILAFSVLYLLNFCSCRSAIFSTAPSLASLFFCVFIDKFRHVLYTVLLLQSLSGQDKCTWLGPFE